MPGLEDAIIRSSNFGWLLMSRFDLSLFFFNPFTKQKIELPPSGTAFRAMCFTTPPTSPDCIVFGLSTFSDDYVDIGTIERGKTDWHLEEYKNETRFRPSTHTPVFHKGSFYCIDLAGKVGIFYPNNSENKWTVLTRLTKRRCERVIRQNFLVAVDGELLAVLNHDNRKVMVERLDRTNGQWKPVQDLGKILYVSHGACFAEDAKIKNVVVYFPKFRDNIGAFYSTNTGKYHSVVGDFSTKTSYDLDEITEFGTWIMPNLDIVLEEQLTW
ncbi:F-box/kelch-repeat protein At1g57790-like [Coffea eugenioides]|uniref:F-box/kelch-repeat protein At1g57790 n=1 Tax=Coffea arabica TaxID=13443 RepID=A0ABM4VWJ6_COFAR|nr:F-box/kelch-repeat protein At1g57790-like [Coffea eugenioides]